MDDLPADYDPSLEWSGPEYTSQPSHSNLLLLRLVILRTSVLPPKQTLVNPDRHIELQFGRDASHSNDTPRVRLKEMAVSKLHATIYWSSDDEAWYMVDMGSMHGTFHQSASAQASAAIRLSPSRVASMPQKLKHMDAIAMGSTTFLVHIHEQEPCEDCSSTLQNEIPLFQNPKRVAARPGYLPSSNGDLKSALSTLKQQMLSSSSPGPSRTKSTEYIDRSARRRALHPTSRLDAPGIEPPASRIELTRRAEHVSPISAVNSWEPPQLITQSKPPTPLPTTNVGHKLLLAQGWTPGSSLGAEDGEDSDGRVRLKAPLEIASTSGRAGLGSKRS
ncbi:hypothetical protein MIND_00246400 [Mycena indigotica]|uniref:Angiogenic factor with G patch and FHA domains 1 n=1 Tax=Mycena indigotica TaxID=2126181 RepID=A0A8H6WEY6_9AGAR|nr:uncharacterized protein MIND_00246400 [Mycena indigotica]KAF7312333.1 hypothetical protein MIND_00246400 [Mycena indigotica]